MQVNARSHLHQGKAAVIPMSSLNTLFTHYTRSILNTWHFYTLLTPQHMKSIAKKWQKCFFYTIVLEFKVCYPGLEMTWSQWFKVQVHGQTYYWFMFRGYGDSREPGPCITNVFATRRKNFSQWYRSFQRKLLSHWLKFLRHVAITLVIQGPGLAIRRSIVMAGFCIQV